MSDEPEATTGMLFGGVTGPLAAAPAVAEATSDQAWVRALLATESPQPALVFAQSAGQPYDMGALLKQTMAKLGGRGGGSKDLAQGGAPQSAGLADALAAAAQALGL